MTRSRHRMLRPLRVGLLAAIGAVGILPAGLAGGSGTTYVKPFTATVSVTPDAVPANGTADAWAGATPTITVSIRNDARPQYLGSANITVPPGIVPDPPLPGGNVIKLRNLKLKPGGTATVSLSARIPCVPDAVGYPWAIQVKQSNDFNGTGNDFISTTPPPRLFGAGQCSLAFATDGQPAGAQRLTNITADPYLPAGTRPVAVRVLDGSGAATVGWWSAPVTLGIGTNPGGGTLSGTTSVVPDGGVARFLQAGVGPRIDRSAGGYRLTASTPGVTATPPLSTGFDIVDSGQRCLANVTCTGTTSTPGVVATVSAAGTAANDLLLLSLGAADAPTFDCAGYTETGDTLAFDVTTLTGGPGGGTKSVLYKILNPTRPASAYDVCFRSLTGFTAKLPALTTYRDDDDDDHHPVTVLGPAPLQPDGSYVGLLPDCRRVTGVPPCVVSRTTSAGAVVLTVTAPAGDPWLRG